MLQQGRELLLLLCKKYPVSLGGEKNRAYKFRMYPSELPTQIFI